MTEDDLGIATDKLLAGLDFAQLSAEREAKHKRQIESLLVGVVEIADAIGALERHTAGLVDAGHAEVPHRSVHLIGRKLRHLLARSGVHPMRAAGKPLDLERHEVVEVRESSSLGEDTVIEEKLEGYVWNDKTLRRARVVVSRPEKGAGATTDDATGGSS